MFVKICGITSEDDALFAVAMGADAVGFVFAPSPRQIAAQLVYDITRRLPPEILTVGVFRDEHPLRVIDTVNRAGLKAAQLHGHEPPEDVADGRRAGALGDQGRRRRLDSTPAAPRSTATDMILVDAPTPGSGQGVRLVDAGGRAGRAAADPRRRPDAGQRR